jgi:hypothetical protein
MVRNEADIIGPIIEHMLTQVDRIIVADNLSTDGTREILQSFPIQVIDDLEEGYYQSKKMTALAQIAREQGAQWVVPFDADEYWTTRTSQTIKQALKSLPPTVLVATADLWDHVATGEDPDEPNPLKRIQWRRSIPVPLPKVACRVTREMVIEQGNHSATYPDTAWPPTIKNLLTVRHFPYRSVEQFLSKVQLGAAAYKATDLPDSMGAHWRQWGAILESEGEEAVAGIFRKFFWRHTPSEPIYIDTEYQPGLVLDPVL